LRAIKNDRQGYKEREKEADKEREMERTSEREEKKRRRAMRMYRTDIIRFLDK
jgi:hypothetical protein